MSTTQKFRSTILRPFISIITAVVFTGGLVIAAPVSAAAQSGDMTIDSNGSVTNGSSSSSDSYTIYDYAICSRYTASCSHNSAYHWWGPEFTEHVHWVCNGNVFYLPNFTVHFYDVTYGGLPPNNWTVYRDISYPDYQENYASHYSAAQRRMQVTMVAHYCWVHVWVTVPYTPV